MNLLKRSKIKLRVRLLLRLFTDIKSGDLFRFSNNNTKNAFDYKVQIAQNINITETAQNKIHNITLAATKINQITIPPQAVFSFWNIVGIPTLKNGFKKSRNLISGNLVEDFGGGLCQLSGIIYHLSLISELNVTERFNHSIDLYSDNERYSPLGADATVVYGYKDLRIKNNRAFPIQFHIYIKNNTLFAELLSPEEINPKEIRFEKSVLENKTRVKTYNHKKELLATSIYSKLETKLNN